MSPSFPVFFNFIVFFESVDEVHDVFLSLSDVFNTKIVHDECETDRSPFVLPVAWCEFALCVACFLESFF